MAKGAYSPFVPARRPGGKPDQSPIFRVLVHRQFLDHYQRMEEAVGLKQAQEFWDHVAMTPDAWPAAASSCILRGKAGLPRGVGWSRTIHYELSSMARANYQYHREYKTSPDGDPHPVVVVMAIDLTSH